MKTANQKQISAILGLSTRQVRNLEAAGMPVAATDGREKAYPLPGAVRWYLNREIDRALEPYETTELQDERRRLVAARATKAELELAREEGRLIYATHLDEVVGGLVVGFRGALDQLPGWGTRLVGIESPAEGRALAEELRDDLLRSLQTLADDLDATADQEEAEELPQDFPGRRALAAAGVETFQGLEELDDLTDVKNIGPKTADAITHRMEART